MKRLINWMIMVMVTFTLSWPGGCTSVSSPRPANPDRESSLSSDGALPASSPAGAPSWSSTLRSSKNIKPGKSEWSDPIKVYKIAGNSLAKPAIQPTLLPGDKIRIDVIGQENLSREFVIPNQGGIPYPLVGTIELAGKNIDQATRDLTATFAKYMQGPVIHVTVVQWKERKVYIYGTAKGSQVVTLSPNETLTVSQLLVSIAVDPEEFDLSEVTVIRKQPPPMTKIVINLFSILENYNFEHDIALQANDFIILKKNHRVYIQGEVNSPGAYPFSPAKKPTLWSLILRADGYKINADLDRIKLIRQSSTGGRRVVIVAVSPERQRQTIYLQPNDVIIVPPCRTPFVTIYGEVKNPGTIQILPGQTIHLASIIARAGGTTKFASKTIRVFRHNDGRSQKLTVDLNAVNSGDNRHNITIQAGDIIYIDAASLW